MPHSKGKFSAGKHASLLFFIAVAAVAVGLILWNRSGHHPVGQVALLQYGDSAEELRIPLGKDETYDIDTGLYTIHLEVKGGSIAFVDSPCPDHTCERFGRLKNVGDWAACLPAKASVTIEEN